MASGLFGIEHSNRSADDHWGKIVLIRVFLQQQLII